jgi:hypothetical protein
MRVLFVSANYSYYFAIDPVVRELFRRGHEVYLVTGRREKRNFPDISLRNAQSDFPDFVVRPLLKRDPFLRRFARNLRELLNYAHVLNHESTRLWDVVLWGRFFPAWLWRIVNTPAAKAKLKDRAFQRKLRALERKIPVSAKVRKEIRLINPDVVLVLPLVNPDSLENEYMRAAQALGIPAIYAMSSWDNTSTKGTFHGYPDYSFVWNKPLADELVYLHGHPRETIYMTGTPRFSHLFKDFDEKRDILSREDLCRQTGLDAEKPYILYVCSTFLVNSKRKKEIDEAIIIHKIARAMETDPRTREVQMLVRPHPLNMGFIPKFMESKPQNVFVFPVNGEIPDTEEKIKRYNSSIYHARAVMGVNTTAYLEVAALDKPSITLYIEEFTETQQLPHFHHLTDAGFLEIANSAEEAVWIVHKILEGADTLAVQRREFVKNFLKPVGSDKPSDEYFADLIEELAMKNDSSI